MTFNPEGMAGEQTASLPGRPGVNGIRVTKKYRVPKEELAHLKRIADSLSLNASNAIIRAEGYLPQLKEGEQPFAQMMFEAADKAEVVSIINDTDMKRITDAIAEARFMADYVVIAMHNHQIDGTIKESVDKVSTEFSYKCIDAGADAIIGTGPHLLRPVEIYKGKPIFYCLGDFIIQLETILRAPDGMFAKQKLNGNDRLDVLFNMRSDFGKRGLSYDPIMYESVIPYWEVENGELRKMTFLPIEEMFALPRSQGGWPRKETEANIMERFAEMSKPYGVDIKIENGIGAVQL
jgi:poly-gamma-glutamate synthesis protein (capsule biosynthesis protein)